VIILLCGTIGWPGTGLTGGAAGVACVLVAATGGAAGAFGGAAAAGGGATTAAGGCTGGVTTTAGGAAGFSTGGGATTAGAAGLTTGGVTTTLLSAAGAAGLGVTTVGFSPAAGAAGAGGAAGLAETAGGLAGGEGGWCCSCSFCLSNFSTSPGLEIFERSSFGLTSVADALSREEELDLAEKCFRTRTASSSSMELEWVFFSVTPTSSSTSRIALLFTSSSLARSLIRIFIRSVFPPSCLLRDHNDLTVLTLNLTTMVLLPILRFLPPAAPRHGRALQPHRLRVRFPCRR
jgi:hypothetical protein